MKTNTKDNIKLNIAISLAISSALATNSSVALAINSGYIANTMASYLEQNDTNKKIDLSLEENLEYIFKTVYRSKISERIAGEDRYETAAILSSKSYTKSDKVVIVRCDNASNTNNPDAFLSAALASSLDYPLLYTKGDSIPEFTTNEIKRLNAKEVIVVGGPDTIPDQTLKTLTDIGVKTTRISGAGRWETSAEIASKIKSNKNISKAIVINSENDKNLNAAISASVALDAPLLYVTSKSMCKEVQTFLNSSDIKDIYVIGDNTDIEGIGIPDSVLSEVESSKIKRINASNASAVSDFFNALIPERSGDSAILINQDNLVDMPLASVYAKKNNMPLFLVDKTIDTNTLSKFDTGKIKKVYGISSNIYSNTLNSIENRIYKSIYNGNPESHEKNKISKIISGDTSKISTELALEAYTSSESIVLSTIYNDEENLDADALLSACLASTLDAPFLCLDSGDTINTDVKNVIEKLGAKKVYIVGGPAHITDKAVEELKTMGLTIERISGDDRWITSAKVADKVDSIKKIDKVIVINHNNTKDIGAAVLASVQLNAPILYSNGDKLTQETLDVINRNSIEKVYVVGNGSSNKDITISNESISKITNQNKIVNIKGGNEEETLVAFSSYFKQTPKKEINKNTINTGVIINSSNKKDIIPGILYANKMNTPTILLGLNLDDYSKNIALHNNLNDLKVISNDVYAYSHSQLEDFIIKNILEPNGLFKDDTTDNGNGDSTTPPAGDTDNGNGDSTTPPAGDTDNGNGDSTTPPASDTDNGNGDSTTPPTSDTDNSSSNSMDKQNPQTGDEGIAKYVIGFATFIIALIGAITVKLKLKKADKTSEIEDPTEDNSNSFIK